MTDIFLVPWMDPAAQYARVATEIDAAIRPVLSGTDHILAGQVAQFEEEFAAYCQTRYAIGVDSGTSALELALRAYGIGQGDQVITAANAPIATVFAITYTGAVPVLVDVDEDLQTLCIPALGDAITPHTRCIVPVHSFGHPADMDRIMELSREHALVVIEEASQAHGARYRGRRVGSLAHSAVFSFSPGCNLSAYGEGGAVVTNDTLVADSVHLLSNYGQRREHLYEIRGYNRRLDTMQAAALHVKLKYLDEWNAARRRNAQAYSQLLSTTLVGIPCEAEYAEAVWNSYVVRSNERQTLQEHLARNGVATTIQYPIPAHLQPAFRHLGYAQGDFPVTERLAQQVLSLPMYPELTSEMIEQVAQAFSHYPPAPIMVAP